MHPYWPTKLSRAVKRKVLIVGITDKVFLRGEEEEMVTTLDKLQEALENVLALDSEEAREVALTVLNYFGYSTVIIDNAIDQEDRKIFYHLHDAGLLNTFWETVILPTGRAWRTFYWELDEIAIERALRRRKRRREELVYESLPDDIWVRAKA